jgi:hypothetical protein
MVMKYASFSTHVYSGSIYITCLAYLGHLTYLWFKINVMKGR